jgi:hypothetical protein
MASILLISLPQLFRFVLCLLAFMLCFLSPLLLEWPWQLLLLLCWTIPIPIPIPIAYTLACQLASRLLLALIPQ